MEKCGHVGDVVDLMLFRGQTSYTHGFLFLWPLVLVISPGGPARRVGETKVPELRQKRPARGFRQGTHPGFKAKRRQKKAHTHSYVL